MNVGMGSFLCDPDLPAVVAEQELSAGNPVEEGRIGTGRIVLFPPVGNHVGEDPFFQCFPAVKACGIGEREVSPVGSGSQKADDDAVRAAGPDGPVVNGLKGLGQQHISGVRKKDVVPSGCENTGVDGRHGAYGLVLLHTFPQAFRPGGKEADSLVPLSPLQDIGKFRNFRPVRHNKEFKGLVCLAEDAVHGLRGRGGGRGQGENNGKYGLYIRQIHGRPPPFSANLVHFCIFP